MPNPVGCPGGKLEFEPNLAAMDAGASAGVTVRGVHVRSRRMFEALNRAKEACRRLESAGHVAEVVIGTA